MSQHQPQLPGPIQPPATAPTGADVTREKLLQATHELLFERLGEEPSVSQICERADVRVAMVSYCFGSKAGLLEALGGRAVDHIARELSDLEARDLPPEVALAAHVRATVRNFVRLPYMAMLSEKIARGDRTATGMAETFAKPTVDMYGRLLEAGAARGVFRPEVDPSLLLFSIVGMSGFIFSARSWTEGVGLELDEDLVERFAEHTVTLVLQGLAPGEPRAPGADLACAPDEQRAQRSVGTRTT